MARAVLTCAGLALLFLAGGWLSTTTIVRPSNAEKLVFELLAAVAGVPVTWWLVVRPLRKAADQSLRRFDAMLETAPDAILAVDRTGTIVLANEQAHVLFGYDTGSLCGHSIESLVPFRLRAAHAAQRQRYDEAPSARRMGALRELTALRKDGTELPVDVSLGVFSQESPPLTLAFVRDMSAVHGLWKELARAKADLERELDERRKLRAVSELLQSLRSRDDVRSVLNLHLEHLFPQTSGAIFVLDAAREHARALVDWGTESPFDEQVAVDECQALRMGTPHGVSGAEQGRRCAHMAALECDYVCVPMLADGETVGVFHLRADVGSVPPEPDGSPRPGLADGERRRAGAVAERLSLPVANLQLRDELRDQTIRDGLTGVFNRRYLEDALAREIERAKRNGWPVGVAMLDIDHFKQLNDTLGHSAGDHLLRAFGRFLVAHFRVSDIVCRYGGEEFAIILPDSTSAAGSARVDSIRRGWTALVSEDKNRGGASSTFSAGVAVFPTDGSTAEALIQAADRALYRAKSEGRNRVVAFETSAGP